MRKTYFWWFIWVLIRQLNINLKHSSGVYGIRLYNVNIRYLEELLLGRVWFLFNDFSSIRKHSKGGSNGYKIIQIRYFPE